MGLRPAHTPQGVWLLPLCHHGGHGHGCTLTRLCTRRHRPSSVALFSAQGSPSPSPQGQWPGQAGQGGYQRGGWDGVKVALFFLFSSECSVVSEPCFRMSYTRPVALFYAEQCQPQAQRTVDKQWRQYSEPAGKAPQCLAASLSQKA
jgi:hypothetical protein